LAKSGPLREKRNGMVNEGGKPDEIKKLEERYLKIEEPLLDIDNERGKLARALGGRTGDPEDYK
jgi:hypothetical protein